MRVAGIPYSRESDICLPVDSLLAVQPPAVRTKTSRSDSYRSSSAAMITRIVPQPDGRV